MTPRLFLWLFLAGLSMHCSCLRSHRPTRIFILSSPEPLPSEYVAKIGKVSLPAYLQRWELVSRLGEQEIRIHNFAQWGQLLSEEIKRYLQQSFSLYANETSQLNGQEAKVPVLDFVFQRFEGNNAGIFTVKGYCRLKLTNTEKHLPFAYTFSYVPDDEEALIKAHEEALRRLNTIIQAGLLQP